MQHLKQSEANQRPFGQPVIAAAQARLEPFRGRAYRFYILLPRYRQRKIIFRAADVHALRRLLTSDFGGCTIGEVKRPTAVGTWELREARQIRVVFDHHSEFTVYTKPTKASIRYFEQLEANLRRHLEEAKGIREEQILIEMTEVLIVAGEP